MNATDELSVKIDRMYILPDAGNLKAFADIRINDMFVLRGCRMVESKKGLFVSLPKETGKDGRFYEVLSCITADAFEAISKAMMDEYNRLNAK
jgi:stage V sporulation protein G